MIRRTKKAFTIVELVIVIAVIAVLTAILVPTFISISNKADKASDQSLKNYLNKALAVVENDPTLNKNGDNKTMHYAVEDLDEYGITLDKIVTKSDEKLVWKQADNRFYFESEAPTAVADRLGYWRIQANDVDTDGYSIYAGRGFVKPTSGVNVKVGFDAGYYEDIDLINYVNSTTQTASIRTNGGKLIINAPSDTVNHYGEGDVLSILAIDENNSYHEYGHFPKASIADGKFVIENDGVVEVLNVTGSEVTVDAKPKASVGFIYADSQENVPVVSGQTIPVTVEDIDFDNVVARTGNGIFTSLHEALADLQAQGEELFILADITEVMQASSGTCLYSKTGYFSIDGQDHTINVSFLVNNTATKIFFSNEHGEGSIRNLTINSTGIKYVFDVSTDGILALENVTIDADNCCVTSDSGGIVNANHCEFNFTKGEHTRNDHQEAWAPVSTQYGAQVNLVNCNLMSTNGYGLLVWPSGGTLNVEKCSIINAKGLAIAWIGNGNTNTKSDSIIYINDCEVVGNTECVAKCNTPDTSGYKAEVYVDGVLVAYHPAHSSASGCPDNQ